MVGKLKVFFSNAVLRFRCRSTRLALRFLAVNRDPLDRLVAATFTLTATGIAVFSLLGLSVVWPWLLSAVIPAVAAVGAALTLVACSALLLRGDREAAFTRRLVHRGGVAAAALGRLGRYANSADPYEAAVAAIEQLPRSRRPVLLSEAVRLGRELRDLETAMVSAKLLDVRFTNNQFVIEGPNWAEGDFEVVKSANVEYNGLRAAISSELEDLARAAATEHEFDLSDDHGGLGQHQLQLALQLAERRALRASASTEESFSKMYLERIDAQASARQSLSSLG